MTTRSWAVPPPTKHVFPFLHVETVPFEHETLMQKRPRPQLEGTHEIGLYLERLNILRYCVRGGDFPHVRYSELSVAMWSPSPRMGV